MDHVDRGQVQLDRLPGRQHQRRVRAAPALASDRDRLALGLLIHVTAVALWAGCLLALVVVLLLPLLSGRDRRDAGRRRP